ncbi:glycosyltransferase family 2 protein [Candidatus Uhrbacteria bacterium]|nr:glycosyltransferase family 2 protein [Candidatus Uhrbacteria bacterium]
MTEAFPKIAVQVVTFWSPDGKKDIERCLKSLERLQYPKDRWAIIIVDNRSPHGSAAEYLQEHWLHKAGDSLPEGFFIKSDENTGFAGGHDRAYVESKKWAAEAVYLLNQDAVMDRSSLMRVVHYAKRHPEDAIVQSRIMLFDQPELLNSQGNCLHFLGQGYADGNRKTLAEAKSGRQRFYASGAAALIWTSAIEKIGGLFDARYFMYHEDVDLSWRARLAGYSIGYATDSIVYHRYEFSRSIEKFFFMERNRFITHLSHFKLPTLLVIAVPMIFSELASLVFAAKSGWLDRKFAAYKALFSRDIRNMIGERRALSRSIRTVKDHEILKHMVGVIDAQEVSHPIIKYVANPVLSLYHKIIKTIIFW